MYDANEDTDPGISLHAAGPFRALRETTRFLGAHRRLFVPLGVLALVALGVHAAADHLDDWVFRLLDAADRGTEALYGRYADALLSEPAARKLAFDALVTLADKERWAKWIALGVELLIDLRLFIGVLGAFPEDELAYVVGGSSLLHRLAAVFGRPLARLKIVAGHLARYLMRPTVEKLYLPVAVTLAVAAGCLALEVAADNAFFALGQLLPASWHAAGLFSPWPARIAAVVVAWRLGLPAITGSLARGEEVLTRDLKDGEPLLRRTVRGWFGALILLPLLAAGLFLH